MIDLILYAITVSAATTVSVTFLICKTRQYKADAVERIIDKVFDRLKEWK